MDLNNLLCVGRSDMYRYMNDTQTQQFLPVVSSFKMDSLRGSVRKDKPDNRSSSRRSSNSPGSPSKSILRGAIENPKQGSPNGNRNVRFRDGRSRAQSDFEYSKLHVNETTQTNGTHNFPTTNDRFVQVYSAPENDRAQRNVSSNMMEEGFKSVPVSSSTPRSARDRSPTNQSVYSKNPNYSVKQRELPRTPNYTADETNYNKGFRAGGYNPHERVGVRRERSPIRSSSNMPKRSSSTTQTPKVPSGQKIIQNMDREIYPMPRNYAGKSKGVDLLDGRNIIKNMDLGHLPKEKSIGIQTQEEEELSKEIGIQTLSDIETQTPRDVSVQTPREVEVQTIDDLSFIASDDEDYETHIDAFSQTMSDDEAECKDAGVQTPRDVGVQTPRTVSIQTSDTSDEEETATVAVQTSDDPDDIIAVPDLDIHTSVWSNTGEMDSFSLSSSDEEDEYETRRQVQSSYSSAILTEESDDEDINLPPHLTEPFPKKDRVYVYDKLKPTSATEIARGVETNMSNSGPLLDHSARQLLERETVPKSKAKNLSVSKSTGTSTYSSPSTGKPFTSKKAISGGVPKQPFLSATNTRRERRLEQQGEQMDETAEAGTQFHSEYHLELQKREDRIKEISDSLDFTTIETHSFDPGANIKIEKPIPRVEPSSAREVLSKNALIKDVNLGSLPGTMDYWHDKLLREQTASPSNQRLVKSVNFNDMPVEKYNRNLGSDYIFFKNTASGSKYESFEPQQQRSIMKPYSGYTPQPRPLKSNPRPSSAPPVQSQQYTSKSGHLTPTLSHLRKQAIRKSATDTSRSTSRSSHGSANSCQRSDTFISSTKPPPQALTLPLSNALPSRFPASPSHDAGTFESLGNQPRFLLNLKDSSNCRPEPKKKESKNYESNKYQYRRNNSPKRDTSLTRAGNRREVSTSSKPPLPRGRNPEREKRYVTPSPSNGTSARDTILAKSTENAKVRSKSADSTRVSRSSKRVGQDKKRDQGTGTEKRYRSVSHDKDPKRVTVRSGSRNGDGIFLGNDTIQRIIENSNF